jgi:hypothetical protein
MKGPLVVTEGSFASKLTYFERNDAAYEVRILNFKEPSRCALEDLLTVQEGSKHILL